jgi:hypothetical protein
VFGRDISQIEIKFKIIFKNDKIGFPFEYKIKDKVLYKISGMPSKFSVFCAGPSCHKSEVQYSDLERNNLNKKVIFRSSPLSVN